MKKVTFLLFCILFVCTQCKKADTETKVQETDQFVFYFNPQDLDAVDNIMEMLNVNCPVICSHLDFEFKEQVSVELYPNQDDYDKSLTDSSVIGSPACSGNRTIKLVSPESPIRISGIPYNERLLMAVHEYVHLLIDEINNQTPVWLDEGLACYEGSRDFYKEISQIVLIEIPEIQFVDLENSYYDTPASDIYSFTAVQYIAEVYGYEKLNQLIRNPSGFEDILSIRKDEFNMNWNAYIQKNYRNQKKY